MSLVELMVGITVGMVVVAAAAMLTSSQMIENRRLLLETQLLQDLRAASDIMTREFRRASYNSEAHRTMWSSSTSSPALENTFGPLSPVSGDNLTSFEFKYLRRSGDQGPYGFQLTAQELKTKFADQWHSLTDLRTLKVTGFDVDLAAPESYVVPCPRLCTDGTQDCWPRMQLRTARISITGQSASDSSVQRTLVSTVRLRNDYLKFNNGTALCPL